MDWTVPLTVVRLRAMDDVFADSVARQRFLAQLLVIFAVLAWPSSGWYVWRPVLARDRAPA